MPRARERTPKRPGLFVHGALDRREGGRVVENVADGNRVRALAPSEGRRLAEEGVAIGA